ncbi:MAG: outer membrane lipoprotein chaperone LolA [Burkholderiales bacterium]
MFMVRVFFMLGWLVVGPAQAAGTDRLNAFMTDTRSAKSEFSQRIIDRSGKVTQESRGTLEFARPGKFRWTYVKPYNQLIVGDGSKVWIYDPDLNQVSIRKIDAALGSTPAALLSGNNDAMKAFVLKDEGTRDGLEWVLATPRQKEANFERIRIGFSAEGLAAMELTDAFGQQTVLKFLTMERNPRIDPSTFQFTPPKGADVIGE